MTKGTFGDSLKRERELRGVTLDEITAATRIATRFLEAIENEQWQQLPGGVFNRGFVRAVARYLGLDEENIVAEYTLAVGDRQSVPVWTGSPPAVASKQPWLAWIGTSAIVLALLAGGWFGARRVFAWRAARRAARAAALTSQSSTETPSSPEQAAAQPASPADGAPSPGTSAETAAPSAPGADPAPSTAPNSPAPGLFELKIEAAKKTKVTVEADRNRVFQGTMRAGENHTFSAKDQFNVSARDAGALMLEMNGKALARIGPPGHAGKVTLTRDSLKVAPGGGN